LTNNRQYENLHKVKEFRKNLRKLVCGNFSKNFNATIDKQQTHISGWQIEEPGKQRGCYGISHTMLGQGANLYIDYTISKLNKFHTS